MHQALALAARGRGSVEPNPMVGAVVVRDGQVVGSGYHQRFGGPHAEVFALQQAGEQARGATLYVTLEPCCHHGKTPPCTRAIIEAGISRVVAAMADPFPRVAGGGFAELRSAGIEVELGPCEAEARRLNAPYLTLLAKGRPWVIAKWAMTLDGKIATRTGDSKWISNEASRRRVHELRGRVDAIITGSGTALADDPLLTARPPGPRKAARIVLDRRGRLPLTSQLVRTAHEVPTILVTASNAFAGTACEVLSPLNPHELLAELGRRRMTNVMLEAGQGVIGTFLACGLIDEVHAFIAPRLIGGQEALSPIGGLGAERIAEGYRVSVEAVEVVEGDLFVRGLVLPAQPPPG
jgi:diaminohydroxyphosphoribosylaminopyrimidine deaminase/5-amino-6-(5-phosphoribosylamino)uracil reductase